LKFLRLGDFLMITRWYFDNNIICKNLKDVKV
jgi:hypothetical protein